MATIKKEADLVPFTLKKDERGNILKVRTTGPGGGIIAGSMQQTNDGLSYLVAGSNVTIVTQSNGQVIISSTGGGGSPSGPASGDLSGSYPNPTVVNLHIAGQTTGDILYFNGSSWVRLGIGSSGDVLTVQTGLPSWSSTTTDLTAQYLLLAPDGTLTNSRVLVAGTGISIQDGGAGGNATLRTNGQVAMVSGTRFQGGISSTSTASFDLGISGSLTQLVDGRSYLVAGQNVTITSQSNGQITIASTATSTGPSADISASYVVVGLTSSLPNERFLSGGLGISITDNGANSSIVVAVIDSVVATLSGSRFSGAIQATTASFTQGISGSLTKLSDGVTSYLAQGSSGGVLVTSASNGQVTVSANDSVLATLSGSKFTGNIEVMGTASFDAGLSGSLTRLTTGQSYIASGLGVNVTSQSNGQVVIAVNDSAVATLSGSRFTGNIEVVGTASFDAGLSGSLTRLTTGQSYIASAGIITVTSQSNGQIVISGSALTSIVASDGITVSNGNSTATVAVDGTVARISGSHFTGGITVVGTGSFEGGISGSLTRLITGQSYIASGLGIIVASQSNGQITVAGNDSVFATLSGSRFTGNIEVKGTASFDVGLSGSLTRLIDGTSYLIAGSNITISSQSNGAITIAASSPVLSGTGDPNASYVLMSLTGSVPNGRQLTAGTGIRITDGGPNANVTVAINDSVVATLSGSRFTGNIEVVGTASFDRGLSGSLTNLTNGTSFMVAGTGVTISSQSNGQVTISSTAIAVPFYSVNAIPHPMQVTGTTETVVGSVYLPAAQYTTVRALLGSTGPTDTGTMRVRRFSDGALIATVGGVVGAISAQSSSTSVVITQQGWYDISVLNSSTSTAVLLYGVQFVGQDTPRQQAIDAIPSPTEATGTTETMVGSIYVTTGTYSYAVAMMGTTQPSDTATLRLRQFTNANVILTLTGSGNLSSVQSTGSVVFPANDWYQLSLANSSTSGSSLCNGLKIVG